MTAANLPFSDLASWGAWYATQPNIAAFLWVVERSEIGPGSSRPMDFYKLVGGGTFTDTSCHPHYYNATLNSTAAGALQINLPTWLNLLANYPAILKGPFDEQNQLCAGTLLIAEKSGALAEIWSGALATPLAMCAKIWASLAGSQATLPDGSFQHENTLAQLEAWFIQYGGTLQ